MLCLTDSTYRRKLLIEGVLQMQIIPVNNQTFGCKFFHRTPKTLPVKINTVNENEQLLSKEAFQSLMNNTIAKLKDKYGAAKIDKEYEIYTRFTYVKDTQTVSGVNDFVNFVESDFTGNLTKLMNEKVKEWKDDIDICRRYEACRFIWLKDDARNILKYELDNDLLNSNLDRNYQIKRDLFRYDRPLLLRLIKDNVVVDYSTSMNDSFEKIVKFYKDNPNTEITEDMIREIAWNSY